jgi:carbonic anhydrase
MNFSRRRALQALGLSACAATAAAAQTQLQPAAAATPAIQLRAELDACTPSGDPLATLLQRSDPQERMQIQQAIFETGCHIDPTALAQGQRPWAALLSCADARVAPEWMFGLGSGELFQVRVAGNSAFNDGIASLEFAVAVLKTPLILVIGHSGCGAVKAAMGKDPLSPLLEDLVQPIRQSLKPGDDLTKAIQGNARFAARQLTERSKILADAQAEGQVSIQAAFFDIATGIISLS